MSEDTKTPNPAPRPDPPPNKPSERGLPRGSGLTDARNVPPPENRVINAAEPFNKDDNPPLET